MAKNRIAEKIKNFALYGDTDKKSYIAVKSRIEDSNRLTALLFSLVAAVLIFIMYLLSFSQEGFYSSKPVYIFGIIFSMILAGIAYMSKKIRMLTYVSVYMAISIFLVYGIAIATLTRPEEQTVTFMVLLIFVPLIFVDRPLRMAVSLAFYITIFIAMAHRTKVDPVLSVDVTDAVIFGMLAIVSETVVYRAKIRGYVLEHRLKLMSETDQLTGLNNRNSYEWKLGMYSSMYKKSICCIYIDMNGLHELNNTKGHKAGDEMLCCIADIVMDKFGKTDSYRIGGDEFVAFSLDVPYTEVEERISAMKESITSYGYHAAVGYEYSDTENADINELIISAESKMYSDKSDYYKRNGIKPRR